MKPVVIDLKKSTDQRDVVHQAVQALVEGKVVALPTETSYGLAASALKPSAVDRLTVICSRNADHEFSFAVKSFDDALDYVPDMSKLARRLTRRCWPGPIKFKLQDGHPDSVVQRLPKSVQDQTISDHQICLQVPAHSTTLQILRLLAGPIVLADAKLDNGDECVDGNQVVDQLGKLVDLVVNDGRSKFGQASSIVQIHGEQYQLLTPGVVDLETIKQMSGYIAVVVCTGNTCRSPMAEVLLKKHLAEKLNCNIEDLEKHQVQVLSAGIAAMSGGAAAEQATHVMQECGLDLSNHRSQPFTERLASSADLILTMTEGHRQAIIATWPQAASRTFLLRKDELDVSDPIGLSVDVYRQTADQISDHLKQWVDGIDIKASEDQK